MKFAKILMALMLSVLMVVSLFACGGEEPEAPETDNTIGENLEPETEPKEAEAEVNTEVADNQEADVAPEDAVLSSMYENMKAVENYEMTMSVDMKIEVEGQTVEMTTLGVSQCFQDPMKMKMDTTVVMSVAGQEFEMPMVAYGEQVGEDIVTYTNANGVWTKTVSSNVAAMQYGPESDFFNEAYNYEFVGESDGLYVYRCTLDKEAMSELLGTTGTLDSLASSGVNQETIDSIMDEISNMSIDMIVDPETGYPVSAQMDMTEILNNLYASMGVEGSAEAFVVVEYTGFNNVEDFEIPAEAYEAQEAVVA